MSWDRDHQGRSRLEGQAWNLSLRCSGNFTWDSQVGNFTHESGIQKKVCVNKQVAQTARSGLQKVIVRKRRLRRSGQWCRVKVRRLWCPAIQVKKVSWKKKLPKVSKVKTGISPLGLSTWSSWPSESIGLSLVILPQRGLAAPLVHSSPPACCTVLGGGPLKKVLFSLYHIKGTCYQHDIPWRMLTFITWLKGVFPRLIHCEVTSSLSPYFSWKGLGVTGIFPQKSVLIGYEVSKWGRKCPLPWPLWGLCPASHLIVGKRPWSQEGAVLGPFFGICPQTFILNE